MTDTDTDIQDMLESVTELTDSLTQVPCTQQNYRCWGQVQALIRQLGTYVTELAEIAEDDCGCAIGDACSECEPRLKGYPE